jgi:hypothetical protein
MTNLFILKLIWKRFLNYNGRISFTHEIQWISQIYTVISKIIPVESFSAGAITLRKWPMKSRDSWIKSTIEYSDWTLAQSYDACWERLNRDNFRYTMQLRWTGFLQKILSYVGYLTNLWPLLSFYSFLIKLNNHNFLTQFNFS